MYAQCICYGYLSFPAIHYYDNISKCPCVTVIACGPSLNSGRRNEVGELGMLRCGACERGIYAGAGV